MEKRYCEVKLIFWASGDFTQKEVDLSITVESEGQQPLELAGVLRPAGLDGLDGRALSGLAPQLADEEGRLTEVLFPAPVKEYLARVLRARNANRLRLRIAAPFSPWLLGLPWELAQIERWAGAFAEGLQRLSDHPDLSVVRDVPGGQTINPDFSQVAERAVLVSAFDLPREDRLETGLVTDSDQANAALRGWRVAPEPGPDREVRARDIQRLLREDTYAFLFSGHHRDGGLRVHDDSYESSEPLSAETLGSWLWKAGVRVAVFLSCDTARDETDSARGSRTRSFAEQIVAAGVPYVVAVQGKINNLEAHEFARGFFTKLATGAVLDDAVAEGRRGMRAGAHLATVFVDSSVRDFTLRETPDTLIQGTLDAHPVLTGSSGRPTMAPWRYRLDVLWALPARPFTAVLADPPHLDLADSLNHVEKAVIVPVLHYPRRGWFLISASGPLRGVAQALPDSGPWRTFREADAAGGALGIVLRHDADQQESDENALDWARVLRSELPRCALILQIAGSDRGSLLDRAAGLARRLGGVELATRPSIPAPEPEPSFNLPPDAARRLKYFVASNQPGRRAPPTLADVGLDHVFPAMVAEECRDSLGDDPHRFLSDLRSLAPRIHTAFLDALAAEDDPALAARQAAPDDAAVDAWLEHRIRDGRLLLPDPFGECWHHEDRAQTLEAVVLGVLRGAPARWRLPPAEELDRWTVRGSALERLVEHVRDGSAGTPALLMTLDARAVALAWRAGIRPGFPANPPEGAAEYPGFWALFALNGLTTTSVTWLCGLSEAYRSVPSFNSAEPSADWPLKDRLEVFRDALRPGVPPSRASE